MWAEVRKADACASAPILGVPAVCQTYEFARGEMSEQRSLAVRYLADGAIVKRLSDMVQ